MCVIRIFRHHGCPKCKTGEEDPLRENKYKAFLIQQQLLQTVYKYKAEDIVVVWGCEWEKERTDNPAVAKYLADFPLRPLTRLQPQKAVKGSLCESYVLYFNSSGQKPASPRTLRAVDMSSLYPHVAATTDFPTGAYIKLVGEEIDETKVSFNEDQFSYEGTAYLGLLQVRVLPPRDLLHPFLLTTIAHQTLAVLCRSCALRAQKSICKHKANARALTDVWTSAELCFAQTLGYKILSYYELMLYKEKGPILKKFTTLLAFHKIRHAGLPPTVDPESPEELERYCSKINSEMQFEETVGKRLRPVDLRPSKLGRLFFKRGLNVWLGHFSTNLEARTETKFIDNKPRLDQLAKNQQIVGITLIDERYVQLTTTKTRPNEGKPSPGRNDDTRISRKACAAVGAFVTSVARVVIYKQMQLLLGKGAEILKVACDAIYFTLPAGEPDPLEYSESFGRWKEIYPGKELRGLCQLGCNNYSISYSSGKDETLTSEAKCSGLTMSSFLTSELDFKVYSEALAQLVKDNKSFNLTAKKYSQIRRKTNIKTISTGYVRKPQVVFSKKILKRRALLVAEAQYVTTPFGYTGIQ